MNASLAGVGAVLLTLALDGTLGNGGVAVALGVIGISLLLIAAASEIA